MKKLVVIASVMGVVLCVLMVVCLLIMFPQKYDYEIDKFASKYGLEKVLVYSIINIESGFDKDKESSVGALGLMQIMPTTAIECAEKLSINDVDLYDAEMNIEIGCYYLAYLMDMFDGNVKNVLSAYNWGLGNVKDWMSQGHVDKEGTIIDVPVKETRDYWKKFQVNKWVYGYLRGVKNWA